MQLSAYQTMLTIQPQMFHIVRVENPIVIPSGSESRNSMISEQFS